MDNESRLLLETLLSRAGSGGHPTELVSPK
jgi:hypothetical protein